MARQEHQYFANRVFHYFENVAHRNKKMTADHFVSEGKRRDTIYRIIKRCEETGEVNFKSIPGPACVKMSPRKLAKVFRKDPNISVRAAAQKLNMPKSTVSHMKVHKLGITARTRKKAPKYVRDQENRAKTGLRKIYKKNKRENLDYRRRDLRDLRSITASWKEVCTFSGPHQA